MVINPLLKVYRLVEDGVKYADTIRHKPIKEFQKDMMEWASRKGLPELASDALKAHPERRLEIQCIVIALTGEGKRVEDSLLR